MPVLGHVVMVLGGANARGDGNVGVGYPGGFPVAMIGSSNAEVIWDGTTLVAYQPGVTSQPVSPTTTAWGPEAGYAIDRRALSPQRSTYFVKHGVDATKMVRDGAATDFSPFSSGEAFDAAMAQWTAMVAGLGVYVRFVLDAVLWIGHEPETADATAAAELPATLRMFRDIVRAHAGSPSARFIVAETAAGLTGVGTYLADVQTAQRRFGELPGCACVRTHDLAVTSGKFGAASTAELGRRLHQARLALG